MRGIVKVIFVTGFVLLLAIFIKTADVTYAQEPAPCPVEVQCPVIVLSPETMLGDFYLGEQALVGGQNRAALQLPPGQTHQITVRNIQNPGEAGFGQLFVYQETAVNVNVRAGGTYTYTLYPRKQFIRGTLNHTCDVRSRAEGEDVSCQVLIDGADYGVVAAGEVIPFILDPGEHVVWVQLVGGSVGLWEPTAREQTTTITAGRTRALSTRFDKRAHLILALNQEGVVGDFYVNDVLIASQAAGTDLYVAPNVRQNVAVRGLTATSAVIGWNEPTSSITLAPNQERTLTLRLQQSSLINGEWTAAPGGIAEAPCDNGAVWYFGVSESYAVNFTLSGGRRNLTMRIPGSGTLYLTESAPNVYTTTERLEGIELILTITFTSPNEAIVNETVTFPPDSGCGNIVNFPIPQFAFRR